MYRRISSGLGESPDSLADDAGGHADHRLARFDISQHTWWPADLIVMRDVLKGDFESALHALIARPRASAGPTRAR